MHNLSRRIAIALQHEERRCQYLTREAKLMLAVQEEITTGTESEMQSCHTRISVALLFCTEQSVVIMCWTSHVCFLSWLKAMEALSPRLDKFFPNASWPEMWRKPMTGVCVCVCWVCYCDFCFLNAHGQHWIYDCYCFVFFLQPVYNRCSATTHQQLAGGELLLTTQNPQNRWKLHPPRGVRAQPQGHQVRF